MNILVLGGTGAMGRPLVQILSASNIVYVTSRNERLSTDNVIYIKGNARNIEFLERILKERRWDVVIDFMVHDETFFADAVKLLLSYSNQYVFVSSARVYAENNALISEDSPRLLDVSTDAVYLRTNEYALAKAREENILRNSGYENYTIIRPSITYNTYRLQLGVLEKENWLYRAIHGRSIVFSDDVNTKITTMTFGDDVAKGIASIVGQKDAIGEAFHVTSTQSLPWSDVLNIYLDVLRVHPTVKRNVRVVMTKKSTNFKFPGFVYQLIYCRYFNRSFDNAKIAHFCDVNDFISPQEGLKKCLIEFLNAPKFSNINWAIEAVNDRVCGEHTRLCEIPGFMQNLSYIKHRYMPCFLINLFNLITNDMRKV